MNVSLMMSLSKGWQLKVLSVITLSIIVFIFPQYSVAEGLNRSEAFVKVFTLSIRKGKVVSAGHGTGFVINEGGYIVTNNHVVKGGTLFSVVPDGQSLGLESILKRPNAEVVWSSSDLDLAILLVKKDALNSLRLSPITLTSSLPKKGQVVHAVGFPGVADSKSIKTSDIVAESTFSSGVLGRLIENGVWRKGGAPLKLVQHSAFINKGNSGGPLIDECNRVIGINTQGALDTVYNSKGRKSGGVFAAGFYYATDVRELIDILSGRNITFTLDDENCLNSEEKLSGVIKTGFIVGAVGFVFMSLLVLYAIRSPSSRKKVARVVETYSRSVRSPRSKKIVATAKADGFIAHAPKSQASLILDGYGSDRQRYRIVIGADDLYRGGGVVVGRDPGNKKYEIDDDSVSRQHCKFSAQGDDLFIADMDSTNGTCVDGRQLAVGEKTVLSNGVDIKLGEVTFKVIAG
ncbi:MAG: hypothetical protein COB26_10280 [Piscirickettsiaceae bacterium]|nr:MAG: hypothetical protein COB26_10280 [Piscirickettsiaceae bacterium]